MTDKIKLLKAVQVSETEIQLDYEEICPWGSQVNSVTLKIENKADVGDKEWNVLRLFSSGDFY